MQIYPKSVNLGPDLNGYGGVRIYRVTREQANQIAKEFPKSFPAKPPFVEETEGEQLFYMNVSHGKQHFIFAITKNSQ